MATASRSIKDVRKALAAALKKEFGRGYTVNDYAVSDPRPPFLQVVSPAITPDQAFGGGAETWEFQVEVGVASNLDKAAQEKADEFITNGKLQGALTADRTLGGLVDGLVIARIEPRQWQQPQPITGWEITVRVFV